MARSHALFIAALLLSSQTFSQPPNLLGYQGRLLKTDGTPAVGTLSMRFELFSSETGGSPQWSETQALGLSDGYYSTIIGSVNTSNPIDTALSSGTTYLELAVKGPSDATFTVLTPRQRITSTAYALWAKHLKGGSVDATSISINGSVVIDGAGKLGAALAPTGCTAGQVLQWSGSAWTCFSLPTPPSLPAIGIDAGTIAAGDDARFGVATSLRGVDLSTTAPTSGQVLQFDGTRWGPVLLNAVPPPAAACVGAGKRLQWSGTAWVCAGDSTLSFQALNVTGSAQTCNAVCAAASGKSCAFAIYEDESFQGSGVNALRTVHPCTQTAPQVGAGSHGICICFAVQ